MVSSFPVQALTFDVFGTVVDVRSSLIRALKQFGAQTGIDRPWEDFALQWILEGYAGGVAAVNAEVRQDPSKWRNVDTLIQTWLDNEFPDVDESAKDRLCYTWHCLKPWDDVLSGMQRLRTRFKLVTLANANVSLLEDIAYHAGLPWRKILSAEAVKIYKAEPEVYQMAVAQLGLRPDAIMMVAAHKYDLMAAQAAGFKTAFVPRPLELGPDGEADAPAPDDPFDLTANDFVDLAAKLA